MRHEDDVAHAAGEGVSGGDGQSDAQILSHHVAQAMTEPVNQVNVHVGVHPIAQSSNQT